VCEGHEDDHTSCANAVQHFLRQAEAARAVQASLLAERERERDEAVDSLVRVTRAFKEADHELQQARTTCRTGGVVSAKSWTVHEQAVRELREALDDPKRYEWGEGPWEHLGDAERDVRALLDYVDALVAERDRLREALLAIIEEARAAWDDVDDLDDTGAHVGVARHARAQASGLSIASDLARAALEPPA
jgi:predicted Zn-ribbon and HTH transcriptional regulator